MKDRVPTKPNRYAVYDDSHNFLRHEYHERADEPTEVGSKINKGNLLPDDVATALGLDPADNPQVKDAIATLQALANTKAKIETGSYTGTGTYGSNNPNSLTFEFAPKFVWLAEMSSVSGENNVLYKVNPITAGSKPICFIHELTETFKPGRGLINNPSNIWETGGKRSTDSKTIYWYGKTAEAQYNYNGDSYYYIAIG